jgi:2-iminoacetate synthase
VEDLSNIAKSLKTRFSSISIEVFPMEIEEYSLLNESGVDGLTIYQETYSRETYSEVHAGGRKKDFTWRLNAPDRGGIAGFSKIGIGSLLGLSDWRVDGYLTAYHARYLLKKYWKSQIQVSFPRITDSAGNFKPPVKVSDRDMTHLICSMRLLLPDSGLALSTREKAGFRDNLLPLGITQISAGSKTSPGGYTEIEKSESQFSVSDERTPSEIESVIKKKGFDPVWKDWDKAI